MCPQLHQRCSLLARVIFNKYFLNVCYVLGAGNTGGVCGPALEGVVFNGAPDSKQTISYLPQREWRCAFALQYE